MSRASELQQGALCLCFIMCHVSDVTLYTSRSTKSEKLYSSSGREAYHASQPTSPTPPGGARLPISPLNTVRGSPYYSTVIPRTSKDDECMCVYWSRVSSAHPLQLYSRSTV